MTTWKRCGITLGAMTALLAMGAPGAFAADESAAPAPQATVAATQVAIAPAAAKPVLPVVGGAKALTVEEKAGVDGASRLCQVVQVHYRVYVLGFEVYHSVTDQVVCVD